MGTFDYIRCDYPLPDTPPEWVIRDNKNWGFQTKDTPRQYMERYTISEQGKLIHHVVKYERDPNSTTAGVLAIPLKDVFLEYHGDLFFYTLLQETGEWFEFRARFTGGQLENIIRVKE